MIRPAQPNDIAAIKTITDRNKRALGFVLRPALEAAQARGELLVAIEDGQVVGFVHYRTLSRTSPGWHTLYEICVDELMRGRGYGAALLDAVPRPVRLRCPVDNNSNGFYAHYGLLNVWTEQREGKRNLNVWQTQPDIIYCAGGNRRLAQIAREAGMLYGTRHDDTPAFKPHMLDINWRRYNWHGDYLSKVEKWRPEMAMVPDYEHEWQRSAMLAMARHLVERGVERVMVCPKFPGAVAHIPNWCLVAVSVPSRYAGYLPDPGELAGRRVHLLGGSPQAQFRLAAKYRALGITVTSADVNTTSAAARHGVYYQEGRWRRRNAGANIGYYQAFERSVVNIMQEWRDGERQLALAL